MTGLWAFKENLECWKAKTFYSA